MANSSKGRGAELMLDPVFMIGKPEIPATPLSPTAITNAVPRRRTPQRGGFLAAEQFNFRPHEMEGNIQRQRSSSKSVASTIKSGSARSNATSTRRRGRETRRQFTTYQPDVSAFQPTNATSTRGRSRLNSRTKLDHSTIPSAASHGMISPKNRITPTKRRPGGEKRPSEIVREGIKEIREGCINPMVAHTKEVMPTKEEVRQFTKKGQGRMFNCANQAFDLYRDSCAAGNDRGGDDVFFVNHAGGNGQDGSANPQAPHSPAARRVVSFDRQTKSSGRSRDVNRDAMSMEDSIRSRSLRYPEASFVENPVDSFPISDTNEEEALEEDAASILDVSVDPLTLRDYRLSLFQNDNGAARAVPRARLGRALQELDHQDETVEELTEEVLETRSSLSKTKKLLKEKDTNIKKQDTAITDLKAKFVSEKHSLHERLQRESEENSKLQSKLSTLSSEVSRLHSILRHAKTDLKKTSNRWVEDSRNEEMSKSSGRSSMMSAEDTAVVSALRFEIVDLKNQLEEAQMFKKLTVVTPEYDSADVERLKKHLERAEIELRRLKEIRLTKPMADQRMIDELRTALAKSEKALRLAAEKNKSLSLELQDTKTIIAALEKTHHERHTQSIAEVEVLKLRLGKLENGAEQARQQADNELAECRMEAEELQTEMQRMAEALAEETHRARVEGSERVKERMQYEYKLEEKSEQGRRFQEQINKLEQSLAKAEEDAAIRKGAMNDIGQKVVNETNELNQRSVKRRLDTPNQLDGPATDRSLLAFQPLFSPAQPALDVIEQNKHAEEEARLKAEVAELSKKLRVTEEIALKAKGDAMYATQEARVEAAEKERELNELKARLAKESQLSGETQKERDFNEAEFIKLKERELNLDNDMRTLQARLDSAESKVQQEMFRAEEERRMAVETDTERVAEIHRLKDELERAKSEKSPHTTVEKLASRIDSAEKELENYRTHSDSGFDVEGHDPHRAMRNARALVREHGMTLGYPYEDGASFISSSDSSSSSSASSLNASRSTMAISNMASPVKSLSTRSVESVTSLQNMATASSFRKGAPSLDKNGRNERFVSPSGSFDTPPGRSRFPLSPPRIKTISTPLSNGTLLPVLVEEISPKTKFGRANKSPGRRTISVPSKKPPVRRLDINNIQRRLLESNDRLSAAKSKLKGLVTVNDENKAEQTRIKSSVDDIFDTISKQTQMALVSNASFDSSRSSLSGVRKASTPTRIARDEASSDESSGQHTPAGAHNHARRTMQSTEQVLERYRRYKANRNEVSPGRMKEVIDNFINEDAQCW